MPELPEVENVGRALAETLGGRRVTGVKASFPGVLGQSLRATRKALVGKRLEDVYRHGKYLILNFAGSGGEAAHLMIHLRMTGQIFLLDGYIPDKHVHVSFDFDGVPVHYRDIRKFGRLTLVEDGRTPAALDHVGPDMLTVRWPEWRARAAHRGLGNIYVDECLFMARVHPLARPRDLDDATLREVLKRAKQVLRLAIKHGGTTFMNFTNFHGRPGNFRSKLRVYGRGGEACRDCGAVLEKIVVAGRGTVFCPACQKAEE